MPVPISNTESNPPPRPAPDTSGGNSPLQSAALSNLRGGVASTPPQQAQIPGGVPGQGTGNPLAQKLAEALAILLQTGPTQENLAALQGFVQSLQQLDPNAQSPQVPAGQGPLPGPPSTVGTPQGVPGGLVPAPPATSAV